MTNQNTGDTLFLTIQFYLWHHLNIRVLHVMPCPYPRVQRRVFYKETHDRNTRRLNVIRVSCKNHCLCNMSWNTPSSGGFQAMAPSEAQPCMSHEQLLSNRDGKLSLHRLEDFFGSRWPFFFSSGQRDVNGLSVELNLRVIVSWSSERVNFSCIVALERKLSQRRPRQELVSIGIMPGLYLGSCH